MNTLKKTMTINRVRMLFLLVNLPMVALTVYVHFLVFSISESYGNNIMENMGLWLLLAFKIIGANLILKVIISDFKIVRR
jgi:hypothetical protein